MVRGLCGVSIIVIQVLYTCGLIETINIVCSTALNATLQILNGHQVCDYMFTYDIDVSINALYVDNSNIWNYDMFGVQWSPQKLGSTFEV
jgi:hypothetical protein